MVLVFFVVNLLRIDLYDVVKEIKKGRDTMKTIIKRSILDYLKNHVLWIGLIIIVASMYQCLSSYLQIHYIKQNEQITQSDVALEDADVMDGYIPTSDDKERRREWEDTIKETLMDTSKNGFGFSRQEADHVMKEIQNMDVKTASEFLESQYGKGYTAEVKALLTKRGVNKLSDINPKDYAALLAEVEVIVNAG